MPVSIPSRAFNIGVWLVLSLAVVTPPRASTQAPAARGPVVTVDFRATGGSGQPVVDLKPQEVVLTLDGRERSIGSLHLIQPPAGAEALPAPFATNSLRDRGRDVVFVVDEESILPGSEPPLKDALTQTMPMLSPVDRVGLLSLHPSGTNAPLNHRHASGREAISGLRGRALGRETAADLVCRTRLALQRMENLFNTLQGPTTTILFFSAALAAPSAAPIPQIGASGGCPWQPRDFDDVRMAALRSGATFYALHFVEFGARDEPAERAAGLEKLAGVVDGQFVRLGGDPARELKRVVQETAAYYSASFEPDPSERNGAKRVVDVRIRRSGVRVHVRPDLAIARLDPGSSTSPRDMMRVPTSFRDLPLRAAAYPSRNPGDNQARVVVLFEPVEASMTLSSAMVGLFDGKGKLVAQWVAESPELAPRPVTAALIAPAGTYRLRVAAVDSAGRSGSVDQEIRADVTPADPVRLSALVLGVPQAGSLSPRLQFSASDAAAVAYLEVYGLAKGPTVTASLELAGSEQGPPLMKAPADVTTIDNSDAGIIYGGFEIGTLAPRDYVIRAVVSVNGKVVGRVTRTLRKTG